MVFHGIAHSGGAVAELFSAQFPDVIVVGCTTMGEIGPLGVLDSSIVVFAMAAPCRVAAERISDLEGFRFEEGAQLLSRLAHTLDLELESLEPERHVVLTLTDGLSSNQEQLFAALGDAAPALSLVGGSAADDFEMTATHCFVGEDTGSGGAVVMLMEPGVPFQPFAIHQFTAPDEQVVITGADPERRLITEINGWPAVREFARLSGYSEDALLSDPDLARSVPIQLGFQVGDSIFIRGIMAITPDGLVLAATVEEGMVLQTARSGDIVKTTETGVAEAIDALGGSSAGILLFNCGGRLHHARRTGQLDAMFEAMTPAPAAGFHTYGEHFGSVLVNYTLTGLTFGTPGADVAG